MTPREVQLSIRAEGDRKLFTLDEALAAAWHGAIWHHTPPGKIPDLEKVLLRSKRKRRPRTLEEDIRRWEMFFAQTGYKRQEAN